MGENTRADETVWSGMLEFEIMCGSSKKGGLRGRIPCVYNQQVTGTISV